MVGFLQNSTTEEVEKEDLKIQSLSDSKKPFSPNDSLDLCIPELEDFSSAFSDSFFDFDPIDELFIETDQNMADLGGIPVDFISDKGELGAPEDSFKIVGDKSCDVEDEFIGKVGSLEGLGQENGEIRLVEGGVEMGSNGVSEKIISEGILSTDELGKKSEDLGGLIEEQLGKVSLDGAINLSESSENGLKIDKIELVDVNEDGMKSSKTVSNEDESDSDAESESESLSSSSSSSSSSSDDEDEDEEEEDNEEGIIGGEKKSSNEKGTVKGEIDIEEGEIMLSDGDEMFAWSDNEDGEGESGIKGPIISKNELKVLPPVPSVTVTLEPHHQTLPVGVILSILGTQVIVEGVEKHNPLNENSILWITETRSPLGIIDEIFGPVKNPYYIVRYNAESEVPIGIQQGTSISFVQEFADHVLNNKSLYQKGYDASGENDEEISEELEFSDDEKEAEYKRMLKMKKRGTNESKPGKRNEKRQFKNQNGNRNYNKPAQNYPLSSGPVQGVAHDQPMAQPFQAPAHGFCAPNGNWNDGNQNGNQNYNTLGDAQPPATQNHSFSSGPSQGVANNRPMAQQFQAPAHGFCTPNGIWGNGFQPQMPQNIGFPSGLSPNAMSWMQQSQPNQFCQTPLMPQQQIGTIQGLPINFNGLPNIGGPPGFAPWSSGLDQNMLNQLQFGMGLQSQHGSMPMNAGGEQAGQSHGFQTSHNFEPSLANSGTSPNFNRGRVGPGSRGGGRRGNRGGGRRGGGGGRGRNQFN